MRYVIVLAAVALSAYLLGRTAEPSPLDYARERAAIAHYEHQAALTTALAPVDLALGVIWRLLPLAVVVGLLVYWGALLWLAYVRRTWDLERGK